MNRVGGSLEIARFAGSLTDLIGCRRERTAWTALKAYLEAPEDFTDHEGTREP